MRHVLALVVAATLGAASVPSGAQTTEIRTVVFGTVVAVPNALVLQLDADRRVQLIGVEMVAGQTDDETYEFAREAAVVLKSLADGKRVWLEFDDIRKMPDGRILAYVYRHEDGLLLNAELIRRGYGSAITRAPYIYQREFRTLESRARGGFTGLWARVPPPEDPDAVAAAVGGVRRNADGTIREAPLGLAGSGASVTRTGDAGHDASRAAQGGSQVGVTVDGYYHASRHSSDLENVRKVTVRYMPLADAARSYQPCPLCRPKS